MPRPPKLKLILALLAVAAPAALPAAANATLSYTKGGANPRVYVAEDNGKGARQVGLGRNSHVSPDGEWVAYERETPSGAEMRLFQVSIHKGERLLNPWSDGYVFAWSPDSTMVAALTGSLNGPQTLLVINVKSLRREKVAKGYFNGVSFAPESDELVYGMSKSENPLKNNIFRYALGGGASKPLTHDQTSSHPLWGPGGQIVFVGELAAGSRKYGPKNELFTMNAEGQRISQLTTTEVPPLSQGLVPLAWSESGRQLLAEFGGEDQSYAVAVNALIGAEKALTKDPETGFQGAAISSDGKTVLGTTGLGFGGNPNPKVVTVPFRGGPQKVLVPGGFEPSWGG